MQAELVNELNQAMECWYACKVFEHDAATEIQNKVNAIARQIGQWVREIITDIARNVSRRVGAVPEPAQVNNMKEVLSHAWKSMAKGMLLEGFSITSSIDFQVWSVSQYPQICALAFPKGRESARNADTREAITLPALCARTGFGNV